MSPALWSRDEAEEWAQLYSSGLSVVAVATHVRRSRTTVYRGLVLVGVRRRPCGWRPKLDLRYWRFGWSSSAIALRRAGATWAEIGEHYGVSKDVARRHVLRAMFERGINDITRRRGPAGESDQEAPAQGGEQHG